MNFSIDRAERIKTIRTVLNFVFLRDLIIEVGKSATIEAKSGKTYLKLWYDASKPEKNDIRIAVVSKSHIC